LLNFRQYQLNCTRKVEEISALTLCPTSTLLPQLLILAEYVICTL
jgi:hypothetical protein